ncbi:PA3496 family putative envelope integrity protein [Pseudomaricurvus sp. HS19]|uniref:PA3496 family putative envelope integrity protein n=1 Tax=Pseudomaricurvus sp. HS19 TaxID=2692626 RepID=UPI00136A546E|nr:hypothetical protein [Pseudomaricurvus sp. HS19]MYM62549.1 hypothetical protein [Pseudomaricurvus sp. HS19]
MSSAAASNSKTSTPRKRRESRDRSSSQTPDTRRRLEDRLEEMKLAKELKEFDFEYC